MPIIITGCGRSGTTFAHEVFKKLGLKSSHEMHENKDYSNYDVISDWKLTSSLINDFYAVNHKLDILKFDILHQVRNPLSVIQSCQTLNKWSWKFVLKFITKDEDLIIRCMRYWLEWNLMAEELALETYRVENMPLNHIMNDYLNIDGNFEVKIANNINSRVGKFDELSYEILSAADYVLFNDIINLAKKYGYDCQ